MFYKNIIIGSGPASVTAAAEILENNRKLTILDIGNEIETEKKKIVNEYLETKNINKLKKQINLSKKKLKKYPDPNLKFPFGSDFVFKILKDENIEHSTNINTLSSNAKGGLSNIWGTLSSPFFRKDIDHWGLTYEEFYKYKDKVLNLIPISSSDDNLNKFFDIKIGKNHTFDTSLTSREILNFFDDNENEINNDGFFYGRSKFAVSNKYSYENTNCKECGLCHYGCPYDCMFNSKILLNDLILKHQEALTYKKNIFVKNFSKKNNNIELETVNKLTNKIQFYNCENLFIGCGPILTASLILRSKILKSEQVTVKESQRFYFPAFYMGKECNNLNELKNTLPELFFEIYNIKVSSKSIHLQFYTFNDLMLKPFEKFFGRFAKYLVKIFPFVFNRLTVIVGYIHSDFSSEIIIKQISEKNTNKLFISTNNNQQSKDIVNKCVNFLKKILKKKFIIIPQLVSLNLPGSSYHYGGSFPMSKSKIAETSTTLNGELYEFKNVFILDASIFPDIPGSPTTFNIAVNSSRIINNLIKDNRI